jgi:ABC-type glycerol-3-phosphate transport system substrate-binding protein
VINMKNFSLGFLALVLLAGCSVSVPQTTIRTQQEAITFLCSDYQRAYYKPLVKSFELANPSISVQLVTTDTTSTMNSDIGSALARTSDAFTYASSILDWSVPQNIVLDLSALAKQDKAFDVQDFYPGALPAFQRDGKLWGLPVSMSPLVVFYDRASFTQAGLPAPHPGWSWDDLLDAASKLTVRGNETGARYGYVDPVPFYTLPILAHQWAKPLVDPHADLRQVRLDRPAVAQALRWYADLALTHQVMPDPLNVDASAMQQLIYDKHAAMWVEDALLVPESEANRTGMAPLPEVSPAEADSPATSLTTRGIFVSAGTTHPEAAWRWVEFLTHQPPASYDRSIPARKSVAEAGGFWNQLSEETASTYRYAIERALVVPDPVRALWVAGN